MDRLLENLLKPEVILINHKFHKLLEKRVRRFQRKIDFIDTNNKKLFIVMKNIYKRENGI